MPAPLHFKKIGSHPVDVTQPWSEELQGVTHDATHWYLGQKEKLWKVPVGLDLGVPMSADHLPAGVLSTPLAGLGLGAYDHMGDLDWRGGHLFVALEGPNLDSRVMVFDAADLRFIASAVLPGQGQHAPWCAVCPADGLLYSSGFDGVDRLRAYAFELSPEGLALRHHHDLPLRHENGKALTLHGVQGGAFAPQGEIYLASNADAQRGVHVFRADGVRLDALPIETEFDTLGEEIEGLCFWELDAGVAPGIGGHVHVVELDNDVLRGDSDELKALHHYRVERARFVANGNPSCREVHRWDCVWVGKMRAHNKRPYNRLERALADGYDGCHYCLPQHDTR